MMTRDQVRLGASVRLTKRIGGIYPGSMYCIDPGPIGVITAVHEPRHVEQYYFCEVTFIDPIAHLEEWANVLYVWDEGDPDNQGVGDATLADLTLLH